MPRIARRKSNTGVYHVVLKGIDGRNIFLDDEDRVIFINALQKIKKKVGFMLYAYCIMNNHVHILMKESEELGTIIKRITVSYSCYHNKKYCRLGHLFSNRYMSQVIENDKYLLTVFCYIHQNPVKAGLVTKAESYYWSSCKDYISAYDEKSTWLDVKLTMSYYSNCKIFLDIINKTIKGKCLDFNYTKRLSDDELHKIIKLMLDDQNILSMDIKNRNMCIRKIRKKTNASYRQLSRVLGIGKNIIERACK